MRSSFNPVTTMLPKSYTVIHTFTMKNNLSISATINSLESPSESLSSEALSSEALSSEAGRLRRAVVLRLRRATLGCPEALTGVV